MNAQLLQLLRECTQGTGRQEYNYRIRSCLDPQRDWVISDRSIEKFWMGYCRLAMEHNAGDLGIAEEVVDIPNDHNGADLVPLVTEIVLQFKQPYQYWNDTVFLNYYIAFHQEIIKRMLSELRAGSGSGPGPGSGSGLGDEKLSCYIFTRDLVEGADNAIESCCIKLHFPFFRRTQHFIQSQFMPQLIEKLYQDSRLSVNLPGQLISENWESMFIHRHPNEPMLLYRSINENLPLESPKRYALRGTSGEVRLTNGRLNVLTQSSHLQLSHQLILKHPHAQNLINRDTLISYDPAFWQPLICSILFNRYPGESDPFIPINSPRLHHQKGGSHSNSRNQSRRSSKSSLADDNDRHSIASLSHSHHSHQSRQSRHSHEGKSRERMFSQSSSTSKVQPRTNTLRDRDTYNHASSVNQPTIGVFQRQHQLKSSTYPNNQSNGQSNGQSNKRKSSRLNSHSDRNSDHNSDRDSDRHSDRNSDTRSQHSKQSKQSIVEDVDSGETESQSSRSQGPPQHQSRYHSQKTSDYTYQSDKSSQLPDAIQDAEALLKMIHPSRFQSSCWEDIGKALYNMDRKKGFVGSQEGLELWIRYTSFFNPDRSRGGECRSLYDEFDNQPHITIKTLAYYARCDNPERYEAWLRSWSEPFIEEVINPERPKDPIGHVSMAITLYHCYWLEFVCSSHEKGEWYRYDDEKHCWEWISKGAELEKVLSDHFRAIFKRYQKGLIIKKSEQVDNNAMKHMISNAEDKLQAVLRSLDNQGYITSLMRAARTQFYDKQFESRLDASDKLMGTGKGVIEITDQGAIHREGKPEDYISATTKTGYYELSDDHPLVEELDFYFTQLFPQPALRDFCYKLCASKLRGRNIDKNIPCLLGVKGNNSKSMFKKLFERTFGDKYCTTMPISAVTGNRSQSGAANPELAQNKCARTTWMSEASNREFINIGILKEMSGGDGMWRRQLYSQGGMMEAMFTVFFQLNNMPNIPAADQAMRNRIVVIPFDSVWSKDAPATLEEQFEKRIFKMDKQFEGRLEKLARAFLWKLVKYYQKYLDEGLQETEEVRKATQSYWDASDEYLVYKKERLDMKVEKVPNPKYSVEVDGSLSLKIKKEPEFLDLPDKRFSIGGQDLYEDFKDWYKANYVKQDKRPTRKEFEKEISESHRLGEMTEGRWYGVKLKETGFKLNIPRMS